MLKRLALMGAILMAGLSQAHAAEPFKGFNLAGKAINPVCLSKMAPWISDTAIIVRSIVLETCQDSNWAFNDSPVKIKGDTVSTEIEGESFSYEVIGRTTSGVFLVSQSGEEIFAYRIDVAQVKDDLLKGKARPAHVLTALGQGFVPCFLSAKVVGDVLVVQKQVSDLHAAMPNRCKSKIETVQYPIAP